MCGSSIVLARTVPPDPPSHGDGVGRWPGGAVKLTHAVDIESTPGHVFSWLDDPARAGLWMSSVSRTEILHRTPDLVGTTFREIVSDEHGATELQGVVTACVPNRQIAFHLDGQFNAVDVEYRLDEVATGTRLTMRADVRFKGTLRLMSMVMWPLFKRKVLGQFRRECAELKRVCERQPAPAEPPGENG